MKGSQRVIDWFLNSGNGNRLTHGVAREATLGNYAKRSRLANVRFPPIAGIGPCSRTRCMTREDAIHSLVRLEQPLDTVRASLAEYEWDWNGPPIARLDGRQVATVLRRYMVGEVSGEDVESWANLLECREDVEFDLNAAQAIFDLANPDLQGQLSEVAPALLSRF